jgi:hypothetical protein
MAGAPHRLLASSSAVLLCAFCLTACGGSSDDTSAPAEAVAPGSGGLSERGIKGESPGEQATRQHLSDGDCAELAAQAEGRLDVALKSDVDPTPPLSHCEFRAPGISLNVYLDSARAAAQRYENRMTEQAQFGGPGGDPAQVPQYVPNVGQRGYDNHFASWVAQVGSLFAVRGNRWLTVTYDRGGLSSNQLRDEAARVAREGFELSAE